ncbi:MAG: hypothetical protein AB7G28_15450 [Pirellulales bacterium]
MRQSIVVALVVASTLAAASSAEAVFIDSTVHYIKSGYHRNKNWPYPYMCPDRAAVREPFEIMVRNGWRRQNLLGPHFFNPHTNQLTMAGELQVRWIMTQAPPQYRQVFVERSIDPAITAERIAATRAYASRVTLDGQLPEVFETNLMAEGRPAAIVDVTNVKFMENMPTPVLPANTQVDTD